MRKKGFRRRFIGAIGEGFGDGEAFGVQPPDHAVFAVDRVRRREELARWLAAQNVVPRRRSQQIGRVRLPALELLDVNGPAKPAICLLR